MPKRSKSYDIGLSERLKDRDYALAYLEAAWEDPEGNVFLLALRDVASAHGISTVAAAAGVNRENLYRGLSKNGNPTFSTLRSVLRAIGVPFTPRPVSYEVQVEPVVVQPIQDTSEPKESYRAMAAVTPAWLAQHFIDMEPSLYCGGKDG